MTQEQLAPLLPMTPQQREALHAPGVLRVSALWYASIGWAVFPCATGGKTPLTKQGFKDASADPAVIERWWASCPTANIGTPTGITADVFDIDAPDGFATFADLLEAFAETGQELPLFEAIAQTGNGGRHLFVAASGDGNGASLGDGLDYRGRGGYVVLPPSRLAGSGTYSWIRPPKGPNGA